AQPLTDDLDHLHADFELHQQHLIAADGPAHPRLVVEEKRRQSIVREAAVRSRAAEIEAPCDRASVRALAEDLPELRLGAERRERAEWNVAAQLRQQLFIVEVAQGINAALLGAERAVEAAMGVQRTIA